MINQFNQSLAESGNLAGNLDEASKVVYCEGHLKAHQQAVATRFCTQCKVALCDFHVLENHFDHVQMARAKVEDLIDGFYKDTDIMKEGFKTAVQAAEKTVNLNSNNSNFLTYEKAVNDEFELNSKTVRRIAARIDELLENLTTVKKILLRDCALKTNRQSIALDHLKAGKIEINFSRVVFFQFGRSMG